MNSPTAGSKEARAAWSVVYMLCYVSGRCCVSDQRPFRPCDCTEPWHYRFTSQSKHWDHTKTTAQKGAQGQRLPEQKRCRKAQRGQRLPEQKECRKAQNESEGTNSNDKSERMLEMEEGQRNICCLVGNEKKKEVSQRLTHSAVFSHNQGGAQKLGMLHFNRCVERDRKPFRCLWNVEVSQAH